MDAVCHMRWFIALRFRAVWSPLGAWRQHDCPTEWRWRLRNAMPGAPVDTARNRWEPAACSRFKNIWAESIGHSQLNWSCLHSPWSESTSHALCWWRWGFPPLTVKNLSCLASLYSKFSILKYCHKTMLRLETLTAKIRTQYQGLNCWESLWGFTGSRLGTQCLSQQHFALSY